ncbi:MAG: DUF2079 domain-containing protein [Propionibacteriaceae bacterium]|nr:DUF2079 domain-containing protein [Propionibacteriaceae bacterium]
MSHPFRGYFSLSTAPRLVPTRGQILSVLGLAFGSFLIYLAISLGAWRGLESGIDLGIFDQAVQSYAAGHAPDVLIKGQAPFNILGDHFSPITMLLAPFYCLWPDARLLLWAQAISCAVTVALIGIYALKRGLGRVAYLLEAAFALSFGLLSAVAFDFHEVTFGLPLLAWALWALLERQDWSLMAASICLCLVKEDMPLVVIGLALVLFVAKRRLFGVLLGLGAGLVMLMIIFVVIPHFSYWGRYTYIGDNPAVFTSSGGFDGGADSWVIRNAVIFVVTLLLLLGVGLISPLALALLPTVGMRLLTGNPNYLSLGMQYGVVPVVIVFMALIDGWSRGRSLAGHISVGVRRAAPRWQRWQLLLLLAMVLIGQPGHWPAWLQAADLATRSSAQQDELAPLLADIPDGASVAADVFLLDRLVDRTAVQVAHPLWTDDLGATVAADYVLLDLETKAYDNPMEHWAGPLLQRLIDSQDYQLLGSTDRYRLLIKG